MYQRKSRLTPRQQSRLLEHFVAGTTARAASELIGIQANTSATFYLRLRKLIASKLPSYELFGEVEADESYFGGRRKGLRGRGAGGKTIVFGVFKRKGKVYTEIVPNASKKVLQGIIRGKVAPESVIHSDGWRGYDGLVDVGYDKHYRVHHGIDEFARGSAHINGIESFWSFAKRRLTQFNGVPKHTFLLHLKETEFRFNHRNTNLYKVLLTLLKKDPI